MCQTRWLEVFLLYYLLPMRTPLDCEPGLMPTLHKVFVVGISWLGGQASTLYPSIHTA